jgi:hypothetical protein
MAETRYAETRETLSPDVEKPLDAPATGIENDL